MSASIRLIVASLLLAATAAACTGGASSGPTEAGSASVGPGYSSAAVATRTLAPSPTPLAGFACPSSPTTLPAPSNRLTDVLVTPRDGYDEVAFAFGPSGSGSGQPPQLSVAPATPPFVAGASGQPLPVEGQTFVALTFHDMVVADDAGKPTYPGPTAIRPSTSGVQEVVQSEAFEGVVGWIVGSRAPGCIRVHADPAGLRILLDVQRP